MLSGALRHCLRVTVWKSRMMTGLFWRKNSEILVEFALSESLLCWSPFYGTETMIFFRCKADVD